MVCSQCQSAMVRVKKHRITMEACTSCGGMWLEKGEISQLLNKVFESGLFTDGKQARLQSPPVVYGTWYRDKRCCYDDEDDQGYSRKRRSLWDIFD